MKKTKNLMVAVTLCLVVPSQGSFGQIPNSNAHVVRAIAQVRPTNSYYLTKKGKATLTDGKQIEGLFYYSSPPFWGDDFFFFYPSDIKSRQKIGIERVSIISFPSVSREEFSYTLKGKHLVRTLPHGSVEKLNTRVLRSIEQSKN